MLPKSGDLFYLLDDSELHIILYKKDGKYFCYGPLKSNYKNIKAAIWALNYENMQNMVEKGFWRILSVP